MSGIFNMVEIVFAENRRSGQTVPKFSVLSSPMAHAMYYVDQDRQS